MNVIGIDLGGTKIASALFDHSGNILRQDAALIEKRAGEEVGALIIGGVHSLLDYASRLNYNVSSVGISVPGIFWRDRGTVWAPNIPGWESYPLLAELGNVLPPHIKVAIDSDRACSILGEVWRGSAKGCRDAIFLAVGTGIGLGIMADGRILRGANDIAGATGWMALDRPFREEYISCGCFEYNASGEGLAKVARDYLVGTPSYMGPLRNKRLNEITAHDVFEALKSNDEIAVRVIDNAIEFWGMAVANYISLFNPEKIILGGGVFGPALQFLDRIIAEAAKWAQPVSMNLVDITGSSLGSDAALFGAGYLSISEEL